MLAQAAGFAFLAALSPTALLVAAVYLGSPSPGKTVLIYLMGAVAMSVVVAVVLLLALRAGGLNHPHQRQPRYGLRLGLGLVALFASVLIFRRKPKPAAPAGKEPGLVGRLITRPGPLAAFAAGALVFTPSVSFVAAVQVIATAHAGTGLVVAAIALVVVIDVMFAWLPLGLYLAAPGATTRTLALFNGWLRAHSRPIVIAVLVITGILLVINGIAGLAG